MEEVLLEDVNIHNIMKNLRFHSAEVFCKEWTCGDTVIGIYLHDEYVFRINSTLTTTILIEYDTLQSVGKVTIVASGGKTGLLGFSYGALGNRERDAKKMILEFKDRLAPDLDRLKCPHCKTVYVYTFSPDVESVSCQNCGRPILIDDSERPSIDGLEIS